VWFSLLTLKHTAITTTLFGKCAIWNEKWEKQTRAVCGRKMPVLMGYWISLERKRETF